MFKELSMNYDGLLQDFSLYPSISSRTAWEGLSPHLKEKLVTAGEAYLSYDYPPIPATLLMSFCRTGNRADFEKVYFARRNALNSLILAECIENKGRFIDDIINGIFVICEETAWQLPAHNSYIRDTPNHILPDFSRPILDLFACETGALLAMAYHLIGPSLEKISPVINHNILYALKNRIFTPYLNEHFWWMGRGDEPMNNWTIWCTQNILLATFLTPQDKDLRSQVFLKACESVDYFLKEYGTDGCCDEGPQYYRHAGLCLFNAMEVLNTVTNHHFAMLYEEEKIKNIAAYISNIHVDGPYYINFADSSPRAGMAGAREFLFGKRTHNHELMAFAARDYRESNSPLLSEEINLFYRTQSLFADQEILAYDQSYAHTKKDIYYPSNGLFITRDSIFCLAVKAGDNADSHNHNDTGSFTIYKNGEPLFVDIGVESYTKKTFSAQRYEIWTMQSDYHNLPTINGMMQQDGPLYKATQIETYSNDVESMIQFDLSNAYPNRGHVDNYIRTIKLVKEKHILITDAVTSCGDSNIILNLITYEKPELNDNLLHIGDLGILEFLDAVHTVSIETLPITDERLQIAWKHDLYRIRIHLLNSTINMKIY